MNIRTRCPPIERREPERERDRFRARWLLTAGRKMTPDLACRILEPDARTEATQWEIAFVLGVHPGGVDEVIKRFSRMHLALAKPKLARGRLTSELTRASWK